jgi:hypothetical protein
VLFRALEDAFSNTGCTMAGVSWLPDMLMRAGRGRLGVSHLGVTDSAAKGDKLCFTGS